MTWLIFVFMTVAAWGLYGVFLHSGQISMADAENGRYKAFFFVGIAYLLIAVIGSAIMLVANGAAWSFTAKGVTWSTIAGIVGAVGAFGVVLAFGLGGQACCRDVDCLCRRADCQRDSRDCDSPAAGRLEQRALAVRARDLARRGGRLPRDALSTGVVVVRGKRY